MKHIIPLFVSLFLMIGSSVFAQDQDRTKKQDRIHQEDHLMLKDGSCLLIKQGSQTKLQEPFKLSNGTVVNPDGSYQLKNQERYQLRNGEYLDMNGNRYLNQNKYNRRIMMTNKQMEKVQMNAGKQGNQAGAGKRTSKGKN